jgi:hypothetical protein
MVHFPTNKSISPVFLKKSAPYITFSAITPESPRNCKICQRSHPEKMVFSPVSHEISSPKGVTLEVKGWRLRGFPLRSQKIALQTSFLGRQNGLFSSISTIRLGNFSLSSYRILWKFLGTCANLYYYFHLPVYPPLEISEGRRLLRNLNSMII